MNVWKWEMEMCCGLHVKSLLKLLQLCEDEGNTTGINVCPDYGAAPQNESLFDTVILSAKSVGDDGKIEITGTVTYWNPYSSFRSKSAVIRSFNSLDECMAWLKNENAASEECAEVLEEHCR